MWPDAAFPLADDPIARATQVNKIAGPGLVLIHSGGDREMGYHMVLAAVEASKEAHDDD